MDIQGKTALVTGSAAGIGRATAIMLAQKGAAHVGVIDIDEKGMDGTAEAVRALGVQARTHRVDLSDMEAIQAWLAEAQAQGGYDILYNNAGVVSGEPQFPYAGPARSKWIVDVNLTSVIVATELAAHAMAARGGGVIINTVSTVALGKGFSDALYAATKTGLLMFTRCCGSLKQSMNVRVAAVLPGLTDTPILLKTGAGGKAADWMAPILSGNLKASADDIARAVIDLIEDDTLAGGDWVAVRMIDGAIQREWGHDR